MVAEIKATTEEESASPIMAEAYILIEASTGKVLRGRGEHQRIYPASMMKVLTALLFMEHLELDEIYIVGREIYTIPFGSSIVNHVLGEAVSGENLLRSIIMPSGNDSAAVIVMQTMLAITGEETMSFTLAEALFAELMNERARELGALNSNFVNASGFHHPNQFTTPYDLAQIARAAMQCEVIMRIAAEPYFRGPSAVSDNPNHLIAQYWPGIWRARNELILSGEHGFAYATGLRTGFTNQAGESVIATATRDGVDLIAVISNSAPVIDEYGNAIPSRWNDARYLLEYGFNNFHHHGIDQSLFTSSIGIDYETLEFTATNTINYMFIRNEDAKNIERRINILDRFAPITEGEIVGEMALYLHGEQIFTSSLIATTSVGYIANGVLSTENSDYSENEDDSISFFSNIINTLFNLTAIPFWLVGIALLLLIIFIKIKISANKRWRNDYTLNKRY